MPLIAAIFYVIFWEVEKLGEILNNTVQIIAIIVFAAGLVKCLIVTPLQTSIAALNGAVKDLNAMLERLEKDQRDIDKRLVAVEESAKSAHKRIDGMEAHNV